MGVGRPGFRYSRRSRSGGVCGVCGRNGAYQRKKGLPFPASAVFSLIQHRATLSVHRRKGIGKDPSTKDLALPALVQGGMRVAHSRTAPALQKALRHHAELEKGLTVRLLPPDADHRLGPAQALARVLLNLTTNAIKFTEEGFVELVAKSTGPTAVEFSVRDTGRGINPEAIETLFRPFRPGPESRGRTFSGTGLGLALCRKLVEAMGSELRYETSPDWGTRFVFSLELPPAASTD